MSYDPLARATRGHVTGATFTFDPTGRATRGHVTSLVFGIFYADFRVEYLLVNGLRGTVQFWDLSSPMATMWLWDFGDGGTSTERNPVHKYRRLGVFRVRLIVASPWEIATVTKRRVVAFPYGLGCSQAVWLETDT